MTHEGVDACAGRGFADGGAGSGIVHVLASWFASDTALGPRAVGGTLGSVDVRNVAGDVAVMSASLRRCGAIVERYAGVVRVRRSHEAFLAHACRRSARAWT